MTEANRNHKLPPQGLHHIKVCCGTACHVKGSHKILNKVVDQLEINSGQVTADGMFSLEITTCQNVCKLAPLVSIDGEVYMDSTPESFIEALDKFETLD